MSKYLAYLPLFFLSVSCAEQSYESKKFVLKGNNFSTELLINQHNDNFGTSEIFFISDGNPHRIFHVEEASNLIIRFDRSKNVLVIVACGGKNVFFDSAFLARNKYSKNNVTLVRIQPILNDFKVPDSESFYCAV